MIFEPITIKNVTFSNRVFRSSIGGRTAFYDGTVGTAFTNFEKRFARTGVGALISATISVDAQRWAPLEYPRINDDRFVEPFRRAVAEVRATGCRYLMQLGDPGYHTQMSLFPQERDGRSASPVFDMLYGYRNVSQGMSEAEIRQVIDAFRQGSHRVREIGCDGIEITASKGYLIHQFLNPATNRRRDSYGGSLENRSRLLREIVSAVRAEIGPDYLFGVRLSAADFNYLPVNVRLPPVWPLSAWLMGNRLQDMLTVARELESLGVDYLHISRGFGFINPKETPGAFPLKEAHMFFSATRHLSAKAAARALLFDLVPDFVLRSVFGLGWRPESGEGAAEFAGAFKQAVRIPIISNGGYQDRGVIEAALANGKCDVVSMARPLLANPDLLELFRRDDKPARPCTHCNRCAVATTVYPLGCYDPSRFDSQDDMELQILRWSAPGA